MPNINGPVSTRTRLPRRRVTTFLSTPLIRKIEASLIAGQAIVVELFPDGLLAGEVAVLPMDIRLTQDKYDLVVSLEEPSQKRLDLARVGVDGPPIRWLRGIVLVPEGASAAPLILRPQKWQ